MKKFKITATLPNGDEVVANVVASSEAAAIARVKATEQFLEFIGDTPADEVVFTCNGDEAVAQIALNDCELLAVLNGDCAVEHKKSSAIVSFSEGRFNATAKILRNPRALTAEEMATAMREVGEWLFCFHREKVFNLRAITRAWMKEYKITNRALAAEIGTSENAFSAFIRGYRPLPYACVESLLIILQRAGQL